MWSTRLQFLHQMELTHKRHSKQPLLPQTLLIMWQRHDPVRGAIALSLASLYEGGIA
jgi:hypothetical protein